MNRQKISEWDREELNDNELRKAFLDLLEHLDLKIIKVSDEYGHTVYYEYEKEK